MSSSFHIASSTIFVFLLMLIYSTVGFWSHVRRKRGLLEGFRPDLRREYEPILNLAKHGYLDEANERLEENKQYYDRRHSYWMEHGQKGFTKEQIKAKKERFKTELSLIERLADQFRRMAQFLKDSASDAKEYGGMRRAFSVGGRINTASRGTRKKWRSLPDMTYS